MTHQWFCLDCYQTCDTSAQCPRCASRALWPLMKWLNRGSELQRGMRQ